ADHGRVAITATGALGRTLPLLRLISRQRIALLRPHLCDHAGQRAGADVIDADIEGEHLDRERPCQANDALFGGPIVDVAHLTEPGHGAGVDDRATGALLSHALDSGATHTPVALEMNGHRAVELILGDVEKTAVDLDARIVHENVEAAVRVNRATDNLLAVG